MNNVTKFDELTTSVRFLRLHALNSLHNDKSGIQQLSVNLEQVANTISWNAAGWMEASYQLQYANWAAAALADAVMEVMEEFGDEARNALYSNIIPGHIAKRLDERAADIIKQIARDCLTVVYRGVEHSSNPMRALDSGAKVDAAKKALEGLCGLSSWNFGGDMVDDILSGKDRREEERREARRKTPRMIRYSKTEDGIYLAALFNSADELLDCRQLHNITRKGDALTAIASWITELRRQRGENIVIGVEPR